MKGLLIILGVCLLGLAALATPIAIVVGVYDWAFADMQFKVALWEGLKLWIYLLLCAIPGFGLYFYGITKS